MKKIILILVAFVILMYGCAKAPVEETKEAPISQPPTTPTEPAKTVETPKAPEPAEEISPELKEILTKGKTKLKSYSYNYKSPGNDEFTQIWIKGNKTKIIPPSITNLEGKFYNTIYLDTAKKTAEAYCVGYSNCGKNTGKIADLDYGKTYIETPIDWLAKVTKATKIAEEMVENKASLKIDTNIGLIKVEKFYGYLYNIQNGDNVYAFSDAVFNTVKDSDVVP